MNTIEVTGNNNMNLSDNNDNDNAYIKNVTIRSNSKRQQQKQVIKKELFNLPPSLPSTYKQTNHNTVANDATMTSSTSALQGNNSHRNNYINNVSTTGFTTATNVLAASKEVEEAQNTCTSSVPPLTGPATINTDHRVDPFFIKFSTRQNANEWYVAVSRPKLILRANSELDSILEWVSKDIGWIGSRLAEYIE